MFGNLRGIQIHGALQHRTPSNRPIEGLYSARHESRALQPVYKPHSSPDDLIGRWLQARGTAGIRWQMADDCRADRNTRNEPDDIQLTVVEGPFHVGPSTHHSPVRVAQVPGQDVDLLVLERFFSVGRHSRGVQTSLSVSHQSFQFADL